MNYSHFCQRSAIALSISLAFCTPAWANLIGYTGPDAIVNGGTELAFMAWENNIEGEVKVAFVKDLGLTMDEFFVSGQQDAGVQKYWYLGGAIDVEWTNFLNKEVSAGVKVDVNKVKWGVFAYDGDQSGEDALLDDFKLYTTLKPQPSGSATIVTGLSDVQGDFVRSKPLGGFQNFYIGMGQLDGLSAVTNGSAVIDATMNQLQFPFRSDAEASESVIALDRDLTYGRLLSGSSAGNLVGKSSWFYKINKSDEFDGTLPVLIDEFDNLGGDGYWGLAAASEAAHAGEYFLSYTLPAFKSAAETASGLTYGNSFARLAGLLSRNSAAGKDDTVLDMATGFLRAFAKEQTKASTDVDGRAFAAGLLDGDRALSAQALGAGSVSAVPEPATWALWAAGLGLLAWRGRHVRRR